MGHRPRGLQRGRRAPGTTSRTTTRARGRTAGARTASPASATRSSSLCLALALWNGRDPILKERLFGLTGHEGNHGEDVKEYWWYLDATPSHVAGCAGATTTRRASSRTPTWSRRTAAAARARARVRAARHRRVRRRPVLGGRGRVRQGRPDDVCMPVDGHQRRPGRRRAARAADAVVPQHLVVGPGPAPSPAAAGAGAPIELDHRRVGRPGARSSAPGPTGPSAAAVLRQRDERRPRLFGADDSPATRRTASTTTCVHGAATVEPGRNGDQGVGVVPGGGPARDDRRAAAAPAPAWRSAGRPGRVVRPGHRAPPRGGRRVLRRARARRHHRRRGAS